MPASPNTKEIILNCMPPSTVSSPSAALSILKAYLCKHGYSVRIIYWNILLHNLENEFTWNKCQNVQGASTLIYAAYLAVRNNNKSLFNEVKAALQTILPVMLNEKGFFDEHIVKYADKLEVFIDNYLESIDFSGVLYFGFSVNDSQWILASVIAEKIKKRNPNVPIVISGINTSKVAIAFLDSFKQFDFAVKGECEDSFLEFSDFILNLCDISKFNVERTYYRENEIVKESHTKKRLFFDLSEREMFPDFTDFFYCREQAEIAHLVFFLDIEVSRGCHWNRCHFCYLNKGIKFLLKSVEKISQEIRYLISTYDVFRFRFFGNDLIGNDLKRFHFLLDELTIIKKDNPNFVIISGEIITFGLSYITIKKMSEAGFINIQIGFESASNSLLKKINKKNTFSSNLNVIKHCIDVGINVLGANILFNLLEETDEDICEAIENLRFFRFIFNEKNLFILEPIHLIINSSSKYFKAISEKKQEYIPHSNLYGAFSNYFDEETKWIFFDFSLNRKNLKWNYFTDMHYYYKNNTYKYKFIHKNDRIVYQEFLNNEIIEQIEFEKNELCIFILNYCYDKPISVHELYELHLKENRNCSYSIDDIIEKVGILFYQGLLYRTPDYLEIVSIVNVNKQEL